LRVKEPAGVRLARLAEVTFVARSMRALASGPSTKMAADLVEVGDAVN
jgi:hypothetical protein